MNSGNEIFTIKARRCKRCGGLLTSAQAIKDGYGHHCKMKVDAEAANQRMMEDQMSLFREENRDG